MIFFSWFKHLLVFFNKVRTRTNLSVGTPIFILFLGAPQNTGCEWLKWEGGGNFGGTVCHKLSLLYLFTLWSQNGLLSKQGHRSSVGPPPCFRFLASCQGYSPFIISRAESSLVKSSCRSCSSLCNNKSSGPKLCGALLIYFTFPYL